MEYEPLSQSKYIEKHQNLGCEFAEIFNVDFVDEEKEFVQLNLEQNLDLIRKLSTEDRNKERNVSIRSLEYFLEHLQRIEEYDADLIERVCEGF